MPVEIMQQHYGKCLCEPLLLTTCIETHYKHFLPYLTKETTDSNLSMIAQIMQPVSDRTNGISTGTEKIVENLLSVLKY